MADTELTESSGRLPQPTEEVHLPDPSFLPVLVALGTLFFLVGLVIFTPVAIIGGVIVVVALFKWIVAVRSEMAELPLEH
jgi:hypothetical protein